MRLVDNGLASTLGKRIYIFLLLVVGFAPTVYLSSELLINYIWIIHWSVEPGVQAMFWNCSNIIINRIVILLAGVPDFGRPFFHCLHRSKVSHARTHAHTHTHHVTLLNIYFSAEEYIRKQNSSYLLGNWETDSECFRVWGEVAEVMQQMAGMGRRQLGITQVWQTKEQSPGSHN